MRPGPARCRWVGPGVSGLGLGPKRAPCPRDCAAGSALGLHDGRVPDGSAWWGGLRPLGPEAPFSWTSEAGSRRTAPEGVHSFPRSFIPPEPEAAFRVRRSRRQGAVYGPLPFLTGSVPAATPIIGCPFHRWSNRRYRKVRSLDLVPGRLARRPFPSPVGEQGAP